MKWNAWLLPLVLSGSLSAVYFLPQAGQTAESTVKMELPGSSDGWSFKTIPPSEDELGTLERDTRFAKAICLRPRAGEISADGKLPWIENEVTEEEAERKLREFVSNFAEKQIDWRQIEGGS